MSLLRAALLRAGIPIVIMGMMGVALMVQGDSVTARSTFIAGGIVAIVTGTSVIYSVDRWTLPVQTTIHFGIMVCTVLPALLLSGWFQLNGPFGYLAVVGIFLTVGIVQWLVFYLVFGVIPRRRRKNAETVTGG